MSLRKCFGVASFCLMILSQNLFSEIVLQGVVTDTESEAVQNALIELIDQADANRKFSTTTNALGHYTIQIIETGINEDPSQKPGAFNLFQNYPNPFNPSTVISYELSKPANIRIEIHNILGQKIKTLFEGFQTNLASKIIWDATDDWGQGVAAGIYIYTLNAEGIRITHKMVLIDGQQGNSQNINSYPIAADGFDQNSLNKRQSSSQYRLRVTAQYIETYEEENLFIAGNVVHDVTVTPKPNPLTVQVEIDEPRKVSAVISTTGGTLIAQGADGTKFTLTFPKGALLNDTTISITPLTSLAGLAFSGGLVGGVQMIPEGLRLFQPATLTIESPKTVAPAGFETVAFAYHQNGEGLYLTDSEVKGNLLTLELWHFCGTGASQGTPDEIQNQQRQHIPSNAEDAFAQRMQEYIGRERQAQLLGQDPPDPMFEERMAAFSREAYDSFIAPQLPIALQDCAAAPAILSRALGWARQSQLLYGETRFTAEVTKILDTWEQAKKNCTRYRIDQVFWVYQLTGTVCAIDKPFTMNAVGDLGGGPGVGEFVFTPTGESSGTWSFTGLIYEVFPYNASSTYQWQEDADGAQVVVMNPGSNWTFTDPQWGTFPLGEGGCHFGIEDIILNLLPLDMNGCGQP